MAKITIGVTVTLENEKKEDRSAVLRFLKLTGEVAEIDLEGDIDSQLLKAPDTAEKTFRLVFEELRKQVKERMLH